MDAEAEAFLKGLAPDKMDALLRAMQRLDIAPPKPPPKQKKTKAQLRREAQEKRLFEISGLNLGAAGPLPPVAQGGGGAADPAAHYGLQQPMLLDGAKLFDRQRVVIDWFKEREAAGENGVRGGIASCACGFGKTLCAAALVAESYRPGTTATLYLCDKSTRFNARRDMRKFYGDTMRVLLYDPKELGRQAFCAFSAETPKKNHVVVCTYGTLETLARHAGVVANKYKADADLERAGKAFFAHAWERVVADESQAFANPRTELYKAVTALRPGRRMCLSGTPMRNYCSDVYAQLMFCGLEDASGQVERGDRRTWTIQHYEAGGLREKHVYNDEGDLDLPPQEWHNVDVPLDEAGKGLYNLFFQRSKQAVDDVVLGVDGATYNGALVVITRLRQICVAPHLICARAKLGHRPADGDEAPGELLGDARPHYLRAEEWLRDADGAAGLGAAKVQAACKLASRKAELGEATLVFTEWSSAAVLVHRALERLHGPHFAVLVHGGVRDRDERFERFLTDDRAKVLVCTMVGSRGLNFVKARHVVLMEPHWNATNARQCAARVRRPGQEQTTHVYRLLARGSIERKLVELGRAKERMAEEMLSNTDMVRHLQTLFADAPSSQPMPAPEDACAGTKS